MDDENAEEEDGLDAVPRTTALRRRSASRKGAVEEPLREGTADALVMKFTNQTVMTHEDEPVVLPKRDDISTPAVSAKDLWNVQNDSDGSLSEDSGGPSAPLETQVPFDSDQHDQILHQGAPELHQQQQQHTDSALVLRHFCFFVFGLLNNLAFVVVLSAAEQLMPNHAGEVLLADVVPGVIAQLMFNLWAHHVSYTVRICVIVVVSSISMFVASIVKHLAVRLLCIACVSVMGGTGEATFLGLSTQMEDSACVSFWASGTGAAGLVGAALYWILTQPMALPPEDALRTVAPCVLCTIVLYFSVIRTPKYDVPSSRRVVSGSTHAPSSARVIADMENVATEVADFEHNSERPQESSSLSVSAQRWSLVRRVLFPWFLSLMLIYLFEYLINQGVVPTIEAFPSHVQEDSTTSSDTSVSHDRLYVQLGVTYQLGVLLSRSSVRLVRIRATWILALLQMVNFVLLLCHVLVGPFLPRVAVFSIVLWEGMIGGAGYVNTFYNIAEAVPKEHVEWSMAGGTVSDDIGVTTAAIIDSFLECRIRRVQGRPCT